MRNTATVGIINSSSFAAKFHVITGSGPTSPSSAIWTVANDPTLQSVLDRGMFMVLGNAIHNELSLPPVVQSLTPASAGQGATVTVVGQYFRAKALQNVVMSGSVSGTIAAATATSLTVSVSTKLTDMVIPAT